MKATAMLEALEDAATRLEVRVSYEPLAATVGHGGLCRVRGQYRVIIDKRATTEERVATLAQALAKVATATDAAALELPRAVRELVESFAPSRARAGFAVAQASPGKDSSASRDDYYADGTAARKPPVKRAS